MALPQNGLCKHGAGEAAADRSQGSHSACLLVLRIVLPGFMKLCFDQSVFFGWLGE